MQPNSRIYVAGDRGLVGSALVRALKKKGYTQILTRTRNDLDLTNQAAVNTFFRDQRPDHVFLAAAKVGGIHANNTYSADFIGINLQIQTNIIDAAYKFNSQSLLFLGSACIYPRVCPQPIAETALLTAPLEPTNEPYAIAKIAGLKTCEAYNRQHGTDFRMIMPNNLYGPGDNFHPEDSHVLPALIHRFHQAKIHQEPSVMIWGTGKPKREFLHVDDMADAALFIMQQKNNPGLINIGTGVDISIADLARKVRDVVGYTGELSFDATKPDGMMRKLLDSQRLHKLGWKARITLDEGLKSTYQWFLENQQQIRK
ncbi:GDP-L-fucose synthase family protein [Magnetococcales bacterium HHB-1]